MSYVSILFVLVVLAAWLFAGIHTLISAFKTRGWRRAAKLLAGVLIIVGGVGFFGAALAGTGAFGWLPASFEWPVGRATGVVSTPDGYFIVPHVPAGRIQVYDQNWKFVRGWNVNARGGGFRLYVADTNRIHMLAVRGKKHNVYDLNGTLLSESTYDRASNAYSLVPPGKICLVPTPLLLWVFSGPFLSWLAAGSGILLLGASEKLGKSRSKAAKANHRKHISIDIQALKRLLSFEYVQVFDIDRLEPPFSFTEHPVPSCGVPIRDPRFHLAGSRAMMRLVQTLAQPTMFIPRRELLKEWEFDLLAVCLAQKGIRVLLLFFTSDGRPEALDIDAVSAAVVVPPEYVGQLAAP